MEECFELVIDRHTQINVVQSVVYNYGCNMCFWVETMSYNSRYLIHGNKLVEMPFVATHPSYKCQGMCNKLLVAIGSVSSLHINIFK
ncbi:hypothetical protein PVL29_002341 [Vitis rotundifolia]|uniref:Increased DNA methylation 1 C-terminal domain-containing protein n=1 Tax=Vitis rotundifolia TaxID=103349 RepID=A0AA39AGP8_VITRO|nr:hypothetical protein PVL29_002341 [Vitis rotundifolia]